MDWVALGIFTVGIIYFAGSQMNGLRGLKKELADVKEENKALREHNEFQDKQIAETHTTSQVILTELKHIAQSIEELKDARRERSPV